MAFPTNPVAPVIKTLMFTFYVKLLNANAIDCDFNADLTDLTKL